MSWKSIVSRAESLLGGRAPAVDLSLLGKSESTLLIDRVRSLAATTNHKLVPVICAELQNNPHNNIKYPKWPAAFSTKSKTSMFPQSLLIPMVGQLCLEKIDVDLLVLHRKMGNIFATINLALALHRTIADLSVPQTEFDRDNWLKNMESGNNFAVLAGDILLASASLELASYRIPKVVETISVAITDAVRAEFSDLMVEPAGNVTRSESVSLLKQWLDHITLRHGSLLGECCAATVVLNSPTTFNEKLSKTARHFGTTWACLSRLIEERAFFNQMCILRCLGGDLPMVPHITCILTSSCLRLKVSASNRPRTMTAIGFTESGLPEPTLADLCWISLEDDSEATKLYSYSMNSLSAQLQNAFRDLTRTKEATDGVHALAKESVDFLLSEAGCQNNCD
ncbi:unnamed protein product [Mesocestoides corti]|uniref:DHHA2 domain-containing protein n=1 Tax=Mesocestoides corti TaxID=53468 RepID=A0A0R3U6B0_MESCO|nr:unnamed protein product [Mesocestoides corti]